MSEPFDIRILRVAESIARISGTRHVCQLLLEIAADVRLAMDNGGRARIPPTDAMISILTEAETESALFDAWSDIRPTMHHLSGDDRVKIIETFITRMIAVSMDDGR